MAENLLEYRIRINRDGVGELASDLQKLQGSVKDVGTAGATAGAGLEKLGGSAKQADAALDTLTAGEDTAAQSAQKLGQAATQGGQQAATGLDQAGTAAKNAGAEADKTSGVFARMGQAWKSTVAQFALGNLISDLFTSIANKLGDMGREFVRANVEMDGMRRALTAIYKDGALAESQIAFLRKTANDAGVSYSSLTDSFKSFAASATAANIPLQVQNDLFASVAQAGATLGLSGEKVSQALLALGQMASKGVVSMEELRGQLGESLPGALSLVSKGLGLAEADLIKLVESGGLAARDLFPALAQSLKTMSGENDGAAASWERLKSAITQTFTAAGDAGGMTALNAGIKLLAALLGAALVPLTALVNGLFSFGQMALATGSIMATLADRTTTWAQKKQEMRVTVDALTEALRANAARVEGVNAAFVSAVGSTDQATAATGRATAAAGQSAQAAAALSSAWVATGFAMREAEANAARLAANAEKNAQAAKSEGEALVALARIRGEANVLADAEAQAAQRNAQALAAVAAERAKALEIAQAELTAKTNLIAGNAEEQKAREKDIKDLGEKVEKLQAEATASKAAADAARIGALAAQAAAEAQRDHSTQIKALVKELEQAKTVLLETERLWINDKKTAEDVQKAKDQLALAQARVNDAYADQTAKAQANVAAAQSDAQTTRTLLLTQMEAAKVAEQRARLLGDEYGARQALIKQKEIEVGIAEAEIRAAKDIATAKIAAANARREELIATGKISEAKTIEIEATIRAAEAEYKLAEARGASVKLQQEQLEKLRQGVISLREYAGAKEGATSATHSYVSAANSQSDAMDKLLMRYKLSADYTESQIALLEREAAAAEKVLQLKEREAELYRKKWNIDKEGFSLDANGQRIAAMGASDAYLLDTMKKANLSEAASQDLLNEYGLNGRRLVGGASADWFERVNKAIGERVVEEARSRILQGKGAAPPGPASMPAPAASSPSSSGMSANAVTYVNNITIPGVTRVTTRHQDAQSAFDEHELLRMLTEAKRVAQ